MDILFLLIPLSVVLVIPVGLAFWWALRGGQFDDLEGPAYRILMDEEEAALDVNLDPDQTGAPTRK